MLLEKKKSYLEENNNDINPFPNKLGFYVFA